MNPSHRSDIPIAFHTESPQFIQVEISSRCNLKCVMCPLTLGTTLSSDSDGHIGDLEWERVVELAAKVRRILMVGFGENAMNPRFTSMLQQMDSLGVKTSFSTNGIGAESFAESAAALHNLTHVNISIDSPDPDVYHSIRGGDLSRAVSGARALARHLAHRLPVTVAAVVSKNNARSLLGFPRLLREIGINQLVLQSLMAYTSDLRREHISSSSKFRIFRPRERWGDLLNELKAECQRYGVHLMSSERTGIEFYEPLKAVKTYFTTPSPKASLTRLCTVPWTNPYVDSRGNVFPCCHSAGSTPLGSVREATLEQIWEGETFQKFRRDLLDAANMPAPCRECQVAPLGEHPFVQYAAEILSIQSDQRFVMRVLNKGTCTWNAEHPLRLGPASPHDHQSVHQSDEWPCDVRICEMQEQTVAPGEIATLAFTMRPGLPARPEKFQLLVESKYWLPETIFECPLPVPAAELAPAAAEVPARGGSAVVALNVAGEVGWQVVCDEDWIRVSPDRGRGPATLVLEAGANPGCYGRTAIVRCGPVSCTVAQPLIADLDERFVIAATNALIGRAPSAHELAEARSHSPAVVLAAIWRTEEFQQSSALAWRIYRDVFGAFPTWTEWNQARQRLMSGSVSAGALANEYCQRLQSVRAEARTMTDAELLWHLTFGAFEKRFPRPPERRAFMKSGDVDMDQLAERCLQIPAVEAILGGVATAEAQS